MAELSSSAWLPGPALLRGRVAGLWRPGLLPWIAPLVLVVLWQGVASAGLVSGQILPSPARVGQTFAELALGGELWSAAQISFARLAAGLALGAVLGCAFGLLIGASERADEWLGPSFRAIAAVPALGWIPVLILLVGIEESLKIIILTKACFVPMAIATRDAWRNVPPGYTELGRVLGLSPARQFLRVRLPAMVPALFGGLRLASGQAFVSLVTCEMLAATEGLGYLMVWGRTLFQMDMVMVGVIVVGAAGITLDRVLLGAERAIRARMGENG